MARMTWAFPAKDVCGMVDKETRVVFAHRGRTKYTMLCGKRRSAPSADELAHREKFGRVRKAVAARMQDPTKMVQDQAAFAAQSKYETLYGYVFSQEWNK